MKKQKTNPARNTYWCNSPGQSVVPVLVLQCPISSPPPANPSSYTVPSPIRPPTPFHLHTVPSPIRPPTPSHLHTVPSPVRPPTRPISTPSHLESVLLHRPISTPSHLQSVLLRVPSPVRPIRGLWAGDAFEVIDDAAEQNHPYAQEEKQHKQDLNRVEHGVEHQFQGGRIPGGRTSVRGKFLQSSFSSFRFSIVRGRAFVERRGGASASVHYHNMRSSSFDER